MKTAWRHVLTPWDGPPYRKNGRPKPFGNGPIRGLQKFSRRHQAEEMGVPFPIASRHAQAMAEHPFFGIQ